MLAVHLKSAFVSLGHSAWRGGVRLLLLTAALVVTILLLLHMMSSRLSAGYQRVVTWSGAFESVDTSGIRIVVFGSQDVLGSAVDVAKGRSTWIDQLCSEVNCTSVVSLVPTNDLPPGLTSNDIYGTELQALQQVAEQANITANPAADHYFLAEQYPVPEKTPDLEAQVKQFLSLPPSQQVPHQTLWIFTFGTWDIWNMAAMPRDAADKLVDDLASHVFDQIEFLFGEALKVESNAYSSLSQVELDTSTGGTPKTKPDISKTESFRIVVPQLFDISLTPGWQARPLAPIPHSKAEQMRNAAALTSRWNMRMRGQLLDWQLKGRSEPVVGEIPASDEKAADSEDADNEDADHDDAENDDAEQDKPLDGPCPRRIGYRPNPGGLILDAMTEEELQQANMQDSLGRGTLGQNDTMRFLNVWSPYMSTEDYHAADDFLFYDDFTVGQRATDQVGKMVAEGVLEALFSAA